MHEMDKTHDNQKPGFASQPLSVQVIDFLQELATQYHTPRKEDESVLGKIGHKASWLLSAIPSEQHPDDVAVDRFATVMKAKLAASRAKGRGGWDDPTQCSVEQLAQMLIGHLAKGNPGTFEDIGNFAMMLHQRNADPMMLAGFAMHANTSPLAQNLLNALKRVTLDKEARLLDVTISERTYEEAEKIISLAEQAQQSAIRAMTWHPLSSAGQIKVGHQLKFNVGDKQITAVAQRIIAAGTDKEEVVYNLQQNYYFITSMALSGTSSAKGVQFRTALTSFPVPRGFALVPLRMTPAMAQVVEDEWDWPDLLVAAEAITEEQLQQLQASFQDAEDMEEKNDPALAVLRFIWNEGCFAECRKEWPEAPAECYIGADPLYVIGS